MLGTFFRTFFPDQTEIPRCISDWRQVTVGRDGGVSLHRGSLTLLLCRIQTLTSRTLREANSSLQKKLNRSYNPVVKLLIKYQFCCSLNLSATNQVLFSGCFLKSLQESFFWTNNLKSEPGPDPSGCSRQTPAYTNRITGPGRCREGHKSSLHVGEWCDCSVLLLRAHKVSCQDATAPAFLLDDGP